MKFRTCASVWAGLVGALVLFALATHPNRPPVQRWPSRLAETLAGLAERLAQMESPEWPGDPRQRPLTGDLLDKLIVMDRETGSEMTWRYSPFPWRPGEGQSLQRHAVFMHGFDALIVPERLAVPKEPRVPIVPDILIESERVIVLPK